jgi:hypothetical protein
VENLAQTAQFLEASSRLRLAAYWLSQLSENPNKKPDAKGQEDLQWAGRFLAEVDWTSSTPHKISGPSGEFAVQATSVRPVFYSSLVRFGQELRDAGINDPKTLAKFFVALYSFLSSPASHPKHQTITPSNMKLGSGFLEEISQSLLVQLSGNGLPPLRSKIWENVSIMGRDMRPLAATCQ